MPRGNYEKLTADDFDVGVELVRAGPARARDGAARGDAAGELRRELDARARRARRAHEERGLGRGQPRPRHVDVRLHRRQPTRCRASRTLPAVDATRTSRRAGRSTAARCASCATSASHTTFWSRSSAVGPLRRRRRRQGHRPAAEPRDPRRGVVRPGLLPRRLGLHVPGHAGRRRHLQLLAADALAGADHLHRAGVHRAARSASTSTSAPRSAAATTSWSPASSTRDNGGHGADAARSGGHLRRRRDRQVHADGVRRHEVPGRHRRRRADARSRATRCSRRRRC